MSSKHRRTLVAVFAEPVRLNLLWSDIEAMLKHYGAVVSNRAGSRVAVLLNGCVAVFHRPHPKKEAKRSTVRNVRAFLANAGVRP